MIVRSGRRRMKPLGSMEVGRSIEVLLNRGEADVWYPAIVRNPERQEVEVIAPVPGLDTGRWVSAQEIADWHFSV
jgi:hypothetical protein